jgi:succinate-semialdehyde dehydrogenase / glutarate-semialdehyde dehydrogenase
MGDTGTLLINGMWTESEDSREIHSPSNDELVGRIDWGSGKDALRAADAAASAFDGWAATSARRRGDVLLAAADLLAGRSDEIALLLARESGKRLPEAKGEIALSVEYFRWFAEEARRPSGSVMPHETDGRRHLTVHRPSGVVASLSPWNFPCSIQARKLAPALASGCTVVARVSEKAPLAVTEMVRCLTDAGMPAGVVNLVHGPAADLTRSLLGHSAVRVVSFTGSTGVGRTIMESAAQRIVRPLLELGGDAPFIVFEDADLEAAVDGAIVAKFRNAGQSCVAANRFLVHEAVYEDFVSCFVERVDAMTMGSGTADPCPDLGPVIDAARVDAVSAIAHDALSRGARMLTRERELPTAGHFVAPMLLGDVPEDARMATEEVFGPAAGIARFRDDDEAVRRANSTEMGLASYLWSSDAARCWRVADRLQTGIIGINDPVPTVVFAPMGGVKQSGLGREGSSVGLEEFQDVHYLAWRP